MKEVVGTAANFYIVKIDEKFAGSAECILVFSEPTYNFGEGQLQERRETGQFRFAASAASLRNLAMMFTQWAETIEEMETVIYCSEDENE